MLVTLLKSAHGDSSGLLAEWGPPVEFDAVEAASLLPDYPNVGTDGSLVLDRVTGVSSPGARFFAHQPVSCWDHRCWGHVDPVRPIGDFQCCRGFFAVPGPLQSVQRAELWGVILALQSSRAVHLGVDNLSVVRHVGGLLDGRGCSVPFELVKDGDLLVLIERILHLTELDTGRISKVKGHADEGMVLQGRVREVDRIGCNAADEAADFGRRRVGHLVIDARNFSRVSGRWYPVILDLHRFFIAIARVVVNHDGRGLFGIGLFCQDRLESGIRNGLLSLLLSSVLMTLLSGPTLLVFWLNGLPFLVPCIGPLGVSTLVSVLFPMWSYSYLMSLGW